MALPAPADVVAFWRAAGPDKWFAKDDAFDAALAARFHDAHHAAARGELDGWQADGEGVLALILLLDQVPRNLWRGSAHAFATDPLARTVAARAVDTGLDSAVDPALRVFLYLPFEHSEDLADQDRCVALCQALDAESGSEWTRWAVMHRDIVERFGRFPHRNQCLGRTSTAAELAFLAAGGFAG
ncbi:MAG TPA: DUF924 family protein [Novosphingobium sp.]|nr:DUF924 family protein [Novosphingobium sp.]